MKACEAVKQYIARIINNRWNACDMSIVSHSVMYLLSNHDNPSERLNLASIINTDYNVSVYITLMQLNGHTQSRKLFVFSVYMRYLC
jgi:hypothetical protein